MLEEKERGRWPLARISRVTKDSEGIVRFVDVVLCKKDEKSLLEPYGIKLRNRHISKVMILLPTESGKPSQTESSDLESALPKRTSKAEKFKQLDKRVTRSMSKAAAAEETPHSQ